LSSKIHNLAPILYVISTSLITYQVIFYRKKQTIVQKELQYEYS